MTQAVQGAASAAYKAAARVGVNALTKDSFQNFAARIGIGADNMLSNSTWQTNYTSRNRWLLEQIYRSSWIAGQCVDTVAVDMTRQGAKPLGALKPEQIEKLDRAAKTLKIWQQLCSTLKWSRLYGGAVGFLMIDGQDPSTPLIPERVGQDKFKGIMPLDRWMLQPLFDEVVTAYGPDWGKPKFYTTVRDGFGMLNLKIHHSRVLRFEGVELPYWQRLAENLWGQSVIERLVDRLMAYDSTSLGAAQLVYKAHLRTAKVKGLRDIIATGGKAYEALMQQLDLIRKLQSFEGMSVIDSEDELTADSYAFSGLDSILVQFGEQISGATGIPLTRLFGQTPSGLNAGEEGPIRNYYDNIKQLQESDLANPVHRVFDLLYRSTFGTAPPEDFRMEFNTLWQLAADKRGELGAQITGAISEAFTDGLVDRQTALKELRQSSDITGMWTNITPEMIEAAEDEPVPSAGELLDVDPVTGKPKAAPGAPAPAGRPSANDPTGSAARGDE